jgi:hypothetical protein
MIGLVRGNDAMPQYAGTKQKVADVILENEGKKPVRIERVQGSFLTSSISTRSSPARWSR